MSTKVIIRGLVQGVGFRPFIYRLATDMGIKGCVSNRNNGVVIDAEITEKEKEEFISRIKNECPEVCSIYNIEVDSNNEISNFSDFKIVTSRSVSNEITQISPDICVCDSCLEDRLTQSHRVAYPFVNCTYCGPRFSIIKELPYDRIHTTMDTFDLCPMCKNEYENMHDRRFHAQPVACNDCGPIYYTTYKNIKYTNYPEILELTSGLINHGGVIAVKGIGGYHLVCDPTNPKAVNRLREIKSRDKKPFAVMFKDTNSVSDYAYINPIETKCLTSWRRPIVLLKQRKILTSGINPGMKTIGCMLPYMPIHYDWFDRLSTSAIVMTSGNSSELPIAITREEIEKELLNKVDIIVHHNRPIHNRLDDSVVQVIDGKECMIRRSRGYTPEAFFSDQSTEGILAFGAEKTNTFALGKGDTIIQSQYIGDIKNQETYAFYTESLERFKQLFRFKPHLFVCDLHPDYLSTCKAGEMSQAKNIPLLYVQHHHAHAVACMFEHQIDEKVLAIVCDGVGLGNDGKAWGGEFLLCDRINYSRLSHFEYMSMPGGDKVSSEPWRMAVSLLKQYNLAYPQSFVERIGMINIQLMEQMIDKNINSPQTSSVGRLFDAFASILGVCDKVSYQAEAPILLEQLAHNSCLEYYTMGKQNRNDVSIKYILEGVLGDLHKESLDIISAKIHHSLAHLLFEKARQLLQDHMLDKVILSGGCFQNKYLTVSLKQLFASENIPVYIPERIPCNDGGISIGQLAIASAHINKKINI